MRCSLYLVVGGKEADYYYVKIGFSNNPENRLIQLDVGPNPVFLVSEYEAETRGYIKNLEIKIHSWLKEYRHRGEWFKLNQDQLISLDNFIVNFFKVSCHYHNKEFFIPVASLDEAQVKLN